MKSYELAEYIKKNIGGFDEVGVIPVVNLEKAALQTIEKISKGFIPEIYKWTPKKTLKAYSYKSYGKWAKSIIVVAKYYYTDEEFDEEFSGFYDNREPDENGYKKLKNFHDLKGKNRGKDKGYPENTRIYGSVARYTWRNNYQFIIERLKDVVKLLEDLFKREIRYKALSNYTSIPEKILFRYSGLADIGKNCVLINKNMGSYFVIGELITDIDLEFEGIKELSPPDYNICGTCNICIESCPTGALVGPGTLNVNRCIQFLSENLLLVDHEIREKWENRVYGCTTCLDSCPYNKNLKPTAEKHGYGYVGPRLDLIELIEMDPESWERRFSGNQIGIRKRDAIIKNAIISLGNMKDKRALPMLIKILNHDNEIIRAHTVWAIFKIDRKSTTELIKNHYKNEKSEMVKSEIRRLFLEKGDN